MKMKPILFNTGMVRAILDNRKTVTRRVVKPQPEKEPIPIPDEKYWLGCFAGDDVCRLINPPCRPGDILYVRETWTQDGDVYRYKAGFYDQNRKWRPSIHMPREAARIFLRVTDVRVKRLQESFFRRGNTIFHLQREGIDIGEQCRECIDAYGSPCCIDSESECGVLDEVRDKFADLWDGTIKKVARDLYGWEANPWVWVIEFERCEKPKGD